MFLRDDCYQSTLYHVLKACRVRLRENSVWKQKVSSKCGAKSLSSSIWCYISLGTQYVQRSQYRAPAQVIPQWRSETDGPQETRSIIGSLKEVYKYVPMRA